ncbi:MAG: trigger factor, partial [Ardenticatenaceae bacterium]
MNIHVEELGYGQVQLTVEVEAAQVEKAKRKVAQKYRRQVKIRGFRPGKAPLNMVLQVLAQDQVMEEVAKMLVEDVFKEALKETEISVYSYEELQWEVADLDPLTYHFTFPRTSVVKLGDVKYIKVERQEFQVAQQQVNQVLEDMRKNLVIWKPIPGPAYYGDQVVFDLRVDAVDGTTVVNEAGRQIELKEVEANSKTINLSPYLVRMGVDEIKEFPLQYPSDWGNKSFAGRTMLYHITLKNIKRSQKPELDDEFAQAVSHFPTLAAWREHIYSTLLAQAKTNEWNRINMALLDGLVDEAEIEYPQVMLRDEIQRRIANLEQQWASRGTTLTEVLKKEDKTKEELEDDLRDDVEDDLRRMLTLSEYVVVHKIAPTPEEIDEEFERHLKPYSADPKSEHAHLLKDPAFMQQIVNQILTRKGLRHLYMSIMGEDPLVIFGDEEEGIIDVTARPVSADSAPLEEESDLVAEAASPDLAPLEEESDLVAEA